MSVLLGASVVDSSDEDEGAKPAEEKTGADADVVPASCTATLGAKSEATSHMSR
jgi:hypothetical protein